MINRNTLAEALRSLGKAYMFVGDFTTVGGLTLLGATEGDIVEAGFEGTLNTLTAPEQTGGAVHQATWTPGEVRITIPVVGGAADLWAKIAAHGSKDGGSDSPVSVVETSVFLIDQMELPEAGLGYDGTAWNPVGAEPDNSLFFPRAFFSHGDVPRRFADGGKGIIPVTAHAMYYAAGPSGKRLYVRGDPVTAGYTTFRL